MSNLINIFKKTFRMFINASNVQLCEEQNKVLNDIFTKITNEFEEKSQWSAPEVINSKAIDIMYKFIPTIEDDILNEYMRIYWNRFTTRFYFRNDFKQSKIKDPYVYYKKYTEDSLKNLYNNYEERLNNINKMLEEVDQMSSNSKTKTETNLKSKSKANAKLKPLIVKLIQDNDYNFITQKDYLLYLIRTNGKITSHPGTKYFNKYCIDFYDAKHMIYYYKGIIYGLM